MREAVEWYCEGGSGIVREALHTVLRSKTIDHPPGFYALEPRQLIVCKKVNVLMHTQ